eukprot:2225184-Pleurochrysis_carterae.AAC.1
MRSLCVATPVVANLQIQNDRDLSPTEDGAISGLPAVGARVSTGPKIASNARLAATNGPPSWSNARPILAPH